MLRPPPRSTLFPTRRSSDLAESVLSVSVEFSKNGLGGIIADPFGSSEGIDRKSTRLNSSHTVISYAVFCLKKKNIVPLTTAIKYITLSTNYQCRIRDHNNTL